MTDRTTLAEKQAHIEHLEMVNIVKRFPGVLANDCINFDVRAGEMHALLGENGAGKSTLMRVLYGLYRPDQGEVRINGQAVHIGSPARCDPPGYWDDPPTLHAGTFAYRG